MQYCNLQYLDLSFSSILDEEIRLLAQNFPYLVYLYLRSLQITDAALKFIPQFCINLKELSLSDCSNITDFGLYELAKLSSNKVILNKKMIT
jgi:F-box and leucine-rich repeat protein 7